jgi:hypothetical protein
MVSITNLIKLLMLQEDVVDTHKKIGQTLDKIEPYVLLNENHIRSIEESMGKLYALAIAKKQTQEPAKKQPVNSTPLQSAARSAPDVCDMV